MGCGSGRAQVSAVDGARADESAVDESACRSGARVTAPHGKLSHHEAGPPQGPTQLPWRPASFE